jgi:hypothetical protein
VVFRRYKKPNGVVDPRSTNRYSLSVIVISPLNPDHWGSGNSTRVHGSDLNAGMRRSCLMRRVSVRLV